jgi:DNA-binding transcriptional MerR regulator
MFSIGDLAKRSGVKVPTIRYYEQIGLLSAPDRTAGNQRRYGRPEADRLAFVAHARDLGLSIEAIRDLIRLAAHPNAPCEGADRIAEAHLADVRARIARLQRLEAELARMATACKHGTVADCAVLATLADHDHCTDDHH